VAAEIDDLKDKIGESDDYNANEKELVLQRLNLEQDITNKDAKDILYIDSDKSDCCSDDNAIIDFSSGIETRTKVEHRDLEFEDPRLSELNKGQRQLQQLMERVHDQFKEVARELNNSLQADDKKIFNSNILDQASSVIHRAQHSDNDSCQFIAQLKEVLNSKSDQPDQIINVLQKHIE